jgi:ferredoxin--NADP+ reductase
MAKSDIMPHAAAAIARLDLEAITLFARRGPADANFTGNELAELGRLSAFQAEMQPEALDGAVAAESDPAPERLRKKRNLEILKGFASVTPDDRRRRLRFRFWNTPVALHGTDGRVRELELADTRHPERRWRTRADLVVTCIGYTPAPPPGLALARGIVAHDEGRVRDLPGAYVVGWAKRGPTGVIPTNRADSLAVVKRVVDDLATAPSSTKGGPGALDALLATRGVKTVDTAAWRRIEAAENAAGESEERPRVKARTWAALEALVASHT